MAARDLTGIGEIHALLGRGTRFSGTLAFEGRARIEGHLEGEILGEGVLVIGEGAEVRADVEVGTLIVRGGVLRGNVTARQLIEIHPQGAVYGDIQAPEIDIAKGCVFEGRCTMLPASTSGPAGEATEGEESGAAATDGAATDGAATDAGAPGGAPGGGASGASDRGAGGEPPA